MRIQVCEQSPQQMNLKTHSKSAPAHLTMLAERGKEFPITLASWTRCSKEGSRYRW